LRGSMTIANKSWPTSGGRAFLGTPTDRLWCVCGFDYDARVTLPAWFAAIVLFLQLPIPLYWFVVRPQVKFWRSHPRAVYVVGLLGSWLPVTIALVAFHQQMFRAGWPSTGALVVGFALIIFECWVFWRVHRDLGTSRLVGKTEHKGLNKPTGTSFAR
jgi:hypothetical protein